MHAVNVTQMHFVVNNKSYTSEYNCIFYIYHFVLIKNFC